MARLARLVLSNFRNFLALELDLPPGVVVFAGDNAQGKTSLLEAVYLLAIARSFRAENERELINRAAAQAGGQALAGGVIEKGAERLQVYVGFQAFTTGGPASYGARKQIRVNRARRTAADLVGLFNAVLFSADDLELVLGPPAIRRRYLDILNSQADPLYLRALQRYQRVLQQRNQLLRQLRDGRASEAELAFWNDELTREGAWLIEQRAATLGRLGELAAAQHSDLSGPAEALRVEYRPRVAPAGGLAATEAGFKEELARLARRERAAAATLAGPHRDDFQLLINGLDMSVYASRGQARSIALALRLAEAEHLAAARRDPPIVLLDDVLSELDAHRRRRVLEKARQYPQVLVTVTDLELAQAHFGAAARYFRVRDGQVAALD